MSSLKGIEVLFFDVFGTVVDWHTPVFEELQGLSRKHHLSYSDQDLHDLAVAWRRGYLHHTRRIANSDGSKSGLLNVDELHRQILNELLASSKWADLGSKLNEKEIRKLNLVWHRLRGWPGVVEGLKALKSQALIVTLSNGNIRLLADMAKYADLPWDVILSSELFNSFKPNPEVYQRAMRHLSVGPEQCAMVAAHISDLEAAGKQGMRTVYIPREGESEEGQHNDEIAMKKDGGNVDVIVQSFVELSYLLS